MKSFKRWSLRVGVLVVLLFGLPLLAHLLIGKLCTLNPPSIRKFAEDDRVIDASTSTLGHSYVHRSNGIIQAHLEGDAAQIGWASGRLLRQEILETESRLFSRFEHYVPRSWARLLLLDWAKIRYAHLDENLDMNAREELAGLAEALRPDPFQSFLPTYQRLVYLDALYDVSLSFERAPMVGCTTFIAYGASGENGHSWLARNFDFEVDDVFDQKKVLYLMFEAGNIPYASIAWPGLAGVVSAMNAIGLALVVHGGRAGSFDITGEPVLRTMRYVMGHAHSSNEAIAILRDRRPMVSHVVIVTDPLGQASVVERVPRAAPYVYRLPDRAVVTNHFIGPAAEDPSNLRVRQNTTTVYRQQRGQQLLARIKHPLSAADFVKMLRDRRGINDVELPLGDRRAIGALIAAHGVVFDTTARKLWLSTAPHLLGGFIEFHLDALLSGAIPDANAVHPSIPADPLLTSTEYVRRFGAKSN